MALVFMDGFDYYTAAQAPLRGWNGAQNGVITGRFGTGQAILSAGAVAHPLPSTYTTLIAGMAFELSVSSTPLFFRFTTAAGVTVATLGLDATNGHIVVKDASGTTVATGTTTIVTNGTAWHYVELKIFVNGASGTCEVHLDGAVEIASTTGNFGSTAIGNIVLNLSGINSMWFDDMYVLDTTGAAPRNTFLGDVRIQTIYPSSDGAHLQWTPNSGTPHFSRVNETTPDGDTSYNSDATPGDLDTYGFQDIDTAATVYALQTNLYARKDDAALRQIAPVIRQGGVDTIGATVTLGSSYGFFNELFNQDPTPADWTPTNVNADEFGVKEIA